MTGRRRLRIAVWTTIAWSLLMAAEASFFDTSHGRILKCWQSPVAALELARDPDRVHQIIKQGDVTKNLAVMNWNTYMDCIFIVLYSAVFWFFAGEFGFGSLLSRFVRMSIIVAAVFDYLEDFGLFRTFATFGRLAQSTVTFTRTVSMIKWSAFAVALWLLGALLLVAVAARNAGETLIGWTGRLILLAALIVSAGLFNNNLISLMGGPLLLALVLSGIALRR